MKRMVNLLVIGVIVAFSIFPVFAKVPPEKAEEIKALEKARGGKVMGQKVGKKVIKAFDLYNEDKTQEAIDILLEIEAEKEFDKANVNRYIGGMYASLDGKGKESLKYLKLAVDSDVLPFRDHGETLRNLGALSMQEGKYEDSIKYNEEYLKFSLDENEKIYLSIANAYYELEKYSQVLEPAKKAIEFFAKYDKPNQNPYILVMVSYYERKMYPEATKAMEDLVKNFPDEAKWWVQLGGFYALLEQNDKALSTYRIAYTQGFLTTSTHIKRLAQFYSTAGIPYKSAIIQEKYIDEGLLEKNGDSLSIVALTFQNAREYVKAAQYYGEAAKLKDSSDLYRKQAVTLLAAENFKGAVKALNSALDTKPKKKGQIYLGLGEAYFYLEEWEKSHEAFLKAKEIKSSTRTAKGWLGYVVDTAKRKGVHLEEKS